MFMVFMNMSSISWYSQNQFVAMEVGIRTLLAIQEKVKMMETPISEATYFYGDNMLVIHNTSKPESTLEKSVMQLLIASSMSLWQWEDH